MNKEIIIKALKAALQNWIRSASPAQLWRVHQVGGLGAVIEVDGDDLRVRIELDGPRSMLSEIGMTGGRLPITEAFRGEDGATWGTPPPLGSGERERWFLASEVAQAHARQYLEAEVVDRQALLAAYASDWLARRSAG
jgi:hypothetical protein